MAVKQLIASTNQAGLQIPLPAEPCERRRELEFSPAGVAPGSVGDRLVEDTSLASCATGNQTRRRWLPLRILLSLLIFPLALYATEMLTPPVQTTLHRSRTVSWYFQSGQWRADIRTLRAACEFLLDDPPEPISPGNAAK